MEKIRQLEKKHRTTGNKGLSKVNTTKTEK
jgi:hypothetical protein